MDNGNVTHNLPETVLTETRQERLLRSGAATPRFLQGVFPFAGRGLFEQQPLDDELRYVVPDGKTVRLVYFRAGNASDDLLYLSFTIDGKPSRYFPVGPKADFHVALAIVEAHPSGAVLEIGYAAPRGLTGTLIIDVGLMETEE